MGTGLRRMEGGREPVRFGVPNHKRRIVSKLGAQSTGGMEGVNQKKGDYVVES